MGDGETDDGAALVAAMAVFSRATLGSPRRRARDQAAAALLRLAESRPLRGVEPDAFEVAVASLLGKWTTKGIPGSSDRTPGQAWALLNRSLQNEFRSAERKRRSEERRRARAAREGAAADASSRELAPDALAALGSEDEDASVDAVGALDARFSAGIYAVQTELLPLLVESKRSAKQDVGVAFGDRCAIAMRRATAESLALAWVEAHDPPADEAKVQTRKAAQSKAQQRLFKALFALLAEVSGGRDPSDPRYQVLLYLRKVKSRRGLGSEA